MDYIFLKLGVVVVSLGLFCRYAYVGFLSSASGIWLRGDAPDC